MFYKLYPNTEKSDTDKFIWLMTTEDPEYCYVCLYSALVWCPAKEERAGCLAF